MQSAPTYIIGRNSSWGSYKNRVAFANNIINSTNCFDDLTPTNIAFAPDYKYELV